MKFIFALLWILFSLTVIAQDEVDSYHQNHHYKFSLDKGFDQSTTDTLKQKLGTYKLVLIGEGGSHYLQFYSPLRLPWIKFLNSNLGVRHFFLKSGHSSDVLYNQYLQTGNTLYLPKAITGAKKIFWEGLFSYNSSLAESEKVKPLGIDFERTYMY